MHMSLSWRSGVASLWIHLVIWHVRRGEKLTSAAVTVLALVIKLNNYVRAEKLELDWRARARVCVFAAKMQQTLQIFCWLGDSVCSAKAPWQTQANEELRIFRYSRIGASVNLIINISACSLLSPTSCVLCFNTKTLRCSSSSLFCEGFVAWFHNIWRTMGTCACFCRV